VSIWSALEVYIDGLIVDLISFDKEMLGSPALQKTKIALAVYEAMSANERVEYLIDSVQRELNAKFKRGITQFECVFEAFGLSGLVDNGLDRVFIEFSALRNSIVHRRSIVDKRLVNSCPWMNLVAGAHIKITNKMLDRFMAISVLYVLILQRRIETKYGNVSSWTMHALSVVREECGPL